MEKAALRYLTVIVICLISVTSALPHIYGYSKYRSQYTPFNLYEENKHQRDELYAYASQVQQVLKVRIIGDSYLWEGKDKPSPFFSEFLSILPIAILSSITGSTEFAFVLSDFLFPALLFLIIYCQLKKKYHYLTSLICASGVIFIPFISTLLPFFSKGGYLWTGTVMDPSLISRTPHPQISLILLFSSIFIISSTISAQKNKKLLPIAAIAGLSLYSSVFVSSTVLTALAIASPMLIKNAKIKEILLSFLVFLLISLPWIINFLSYSQFLNDSDFFLRASYSEELLFPRQLRYIFFALILFFLSKSSLSKVIIVFTLSAGILMDFHQILLDRSIDADHWISRVIAPVATLAVFLALGIALEKAKLLRAISPLILIIIIALGLFFQIQWINKNREFLSPDRQKAEIFENIEKNTQKDDVIAATTLDLNQFIPGATGRYIYIGPPERALIDSQDHLKRICDIYQISKEKNLSTPPSQLLEQEVYFENWKLNKQIEKEDFLKECFAKPHSYYKIDYIVDKKPDGKYELIKY